MSPHTLISLAVLVFAISQSYCVFASEERKKELKSLPSIAEIKQAWQSRFAKIETLYCSWTSEIEVPARSQMVQNPDTLKLKPAPDSDLNFEGKKRIYLGKGGKCHYESDGMQLVNELQSFVPRKFLAATDRKNPPRSFFEGDRSGQQRFAPLGFISNGQDIFQLNDLANGGPVFFYCRPDAQSVRSYCLLTGARVLERIEVDGRDQIVVEHGESPRVTRLFLDAERHYVPTKIIRMSKSPVTGNLFELFAIDVNYKDEATDLAIIGWKISSFHSELESVGVETAQVTEFIVNPEIDDEKFYLEFPPGTKVVDHSGSETKVFILRNDGSKRLITVSEREKRVPYKTLLVTEPQGHKK